MSLYLSVQKTDPSARGAWRTLSCAKKAEAICPFHSVLRLVNLQTERLARKWLEVGPGTHLVSCRDDPCCLVEKENLVCLAQRHAEVIAQGLAEASDIDVKRATGHFARRSGAKSWAREGIPLASIQWMSRHSSSVIIEYVEEAWAENPRKSFKFQDVASIFDLLTSAMSRLARTEDDCHSHQSHLGKLDSELKSLAEHVSASGKGRIQAEAGPYPRLELNEVREELKSMVIPLKVCLTRTKFLHAVDQRACFRSSPRTWTTKCGWPFMEAREGQVIYEGEEIDQSNVELCGKCSR